MTDKEIFALCDKDGTVSGDCYPVKPHLKYRGGARPPGAPLRGFGQPGGLPLPTPVRSVLTEHYAADLRTETANQKIRFVGGEIALSILRLFAARKD